MGGGKNKNQKRPRHSNSPNSENQNQENATSSSSNSDLINRLMEENDTLREKIDDLINSNVQLASEIKRINQVYIENQQKLNLLENRVDVLENEKISLVNRLERTEISLNRRTIRFLGNKNSLPDLSSAKSIVENIIGKIVGAAAGKIRNFSFFKNLNGHVAVASLDSSEDVDFIFRNAKNIYIQHKIRIARQLTKQQLSEKQLAIDRALEKNPTGKIKFIRSYPMAYVDDEIVWPIKSKQNYQKINPAIANPSTSFASPNAAIKSDETNTNQDPIDVKSPQESPEIPRSSCSRSKNVEEEKLDLLNLSNDQTAESTAGETDGTISREIMSRLFEENCRELKKVLERLKVATDGGGN